MIRQPPRFTHPNTLFPSTKLCRSPQPGASRINFRFVMQGLARPVAQPAQNARRDRLLRAAKHQAALAKHHPPGRQGRPVNTNIRSLKGENRALDKGNTIRRSEEHTSELQSLMRISYAVFCLKKKNTNTH